MNIYKIFILVFFVDFLQTKNCRPFVDLQSENYIDNFPKLKNYNN